ncbi:uncharacterized protein EI90DRAFT_3134148 [Cantharellus anzutake]|uniref:uncharacterized protein n=1 Tax=Cantharellus anzutake TaxID=1750568 RepID=UPI0019076ADA|nr:uncharacterized protein EI90DRAFT_3134148 [Cantharellus anzutake]KAF8316921.1 hypothetical protein EI90DRAFT_3134148 [Cantharellus anzutake]
MPRTSNKAASGVTQALTSCSKQVHQVLNAKQIMELEFHWNQLIDKLGKGNGLSKEQVLAVVRTNAKALDEHSMLPLLQQAVEHYDSFESSRASHCSKVSLANGLQLGKWQTLAQMTEPNSVPGIKVHLVDFDETSDACFKLCMTHHWVFEANGGCTEDAETVKKKFYVGENKDEWLVLDAESSHIVLNRSIPALFSPSITSDSKGYYFEFMSYPYKPDPNPTSRPSTLPPLESYPTPVHSDTERLLTILGTVTFRSPVHLRPQ